jgi:hypothetical protein
MLWRYRRAFNMKVFPAEGVDVIHPQTTITVKVFGGGTEAIAFAPENVTLRIKRGQPYVASNGLTSIDTEMVELLLAGNSKLLGPIVLRGGSETPGNASRPIVGKIVEEVPGEPFPALNFFDVLLQVETERGVFVNKKPEHMVATIDEIPPNFAKTPYRATTEINLYPREDPEADPVAVITFAQHLQ